MGGNAKADMTLGGVAKGNTGGGGDERVIQQ